MLKKCLAILLIFLGKILNIIKASDCKANDKGECVNQRLKFKNKPMISSPAILIYPMTPLNLNTFNNSKINIVSNFFFDNLFFSFLRI